jgi:myo-inositol 2-dehydrogenase / D-chiro-inositol 1-dehydrogenase
VAYNIGLIGAGRMGALHAANAASNSRLDLCWIADTDRASAESLCERHNAAACGADDLLANPDVAGLIIASSSDSLLDLTIRARRAGKAVFVEKPLSLSVEALEAATSALSGQGPPVFVAFNRRFDPAFCALKARLDAGELGRLETLHLISHDPQAPSLAFIPRSGGLFRDFTVHDFDTARWLLGEAIVEVFAWASCLVDPAIAELGDVDTAKLVMRTSSGRLCMISNSRRSGYGYDQRIEAYGSKGALRVDNPEDGGVVRWGPEGRRGDPFFQSFHSRYAEAYRRETDHFADLIAGKADPRMTIEAAVAAVRLAEAAGESLRKGQPVGLALEEQQHA